MDFSFLKQYSFLAKVLIRIRYQSIHNRNYRNFDQKFKIKMISVRNNFEQEQIFIDHGLLLRN